MSESSERSETWTSTYQIEKSGPMALSTYYKVVETRTNGRLEFVQIIGRFATEEAAREALISAGFIKA